MQYDDDHGDLLWDWDLRTNLVQWNASAVAVLGVDAVSDIQQWRDSLHPDDRERVLDRLETVLASETSGTAERYRVRLASGGYGDVISRGFIDRDPAGSATRMIGSMRDVTALAPMDAALLLHERMVPLHLLAAGVGHEINNPLTYVVGNLELALEVLANDDPARVLVEEARDGALRIAQIVATLQVGERGERCAIITPVREKPRVLIIDDEILIGRMIQRILRDAEVVIMTSARAAFALLKGPERFDLVLCDLMMPDMTGIELHAVVRRDVPELLPSMYFMTGGAFTPHAQAFLETIGPARLDKPLGSATLRALLAKHVAS